MDLLQEAPLQTHKSYQHDQCGFPCTHCLQNSSPSDHQYTNYAVQLISMDSITAEFPPPPIHKLCQSSFLWTHTECTIPIHKSYKCLFELWTHYKMLHLPYTDYTIVDFYELSTDCTACNTQIIPKYICIKSLQNASSNTQILTICSVYWL